MYTEQLNKGSKQTAFKKAPYSTPFTRSHGQESNCTITMYNDLSPTGASLSTPTIHTRTEKQTQIHPLTDTYVVTHGRIPRQTHTYRDPCRQAQRHTNKCTQTGTCCTDTQAHTHPHIFGSILSQLLASTRPLPLITEAAITRPRSPEAPSPKPKEPSSRPLHPGSPAPASSDLTLTQGSKLGRQREQLSPL